MRGRWLLGELAESARINTASSIRRLAMRSRKPGRGVTLLETLLVIGILVCFGIMLFPAIQASREKARQAQCSNHMKHIVLAVLNYEQFRAVYPPSSTVTQDADGKITAVDGWSWQVLVLPYLEADGRLDNNRLYEALDILHGRPLVEPSGAKGTPHADILATSRPSLLCPSFDGSPYTTIGGRKVAITNYRGSGATHIESLSVASANPLTPKYNPSAENLHPDGVLFPGKGIEVRAITKGTSQTILAVESVEPNFSRWTVGADASVVGLSRNVEFEKSDRNPFFSMAVKGLSKTYHVRDKDRYATDEAAGYVDPVYWTYRTYLDLDCDRNPYDGVDGLHGGRYGASSHHPTTVNHLFADGSLISLNKDFDVNFYMWLIKRDTR
jgi:hypothetical protein